MSSLDTREEALDTLDYNYGQAQYYWGKCLESEGFAYTHYLGAEVLECLFDVLMCINYLRNGLGWLAYETSGYPRSCDMVYFLDAFAGGEVTYKTICEAWGKDDFEGRAATIAFIDRMRQLLWDEPYYVLWAAKPEEQEL